MRLENEFFLALGSVREFRKQVLNPETRMTAVGGGFSIEGFGLEPHDRIILPQITADTATEFAKQYMEKKQEILQKKP
jgi:hypothetical protein